jgi:hypothetical protein
MPELLPAFDGAIFAAAHIFGCPTGQAPVLGNTVRRGSTIFMCLFHNQIASRHCFKIVGYVQGPRCRGMTCLILID